jgi:hypothetical protein
VVAGNFLTLFNNNGFFGGVTTGFDTRLEASTVFQDKTLITDETQLVKTNNASEAPRPTSPSKDILGRIFPDPRVLPHVSPFHLLREFAAKQQRPMLAEPVRHTESRTDLQ